MADRAWSETRPDVDLDALERVRLGLFDLRQAADSGELPSDLQAHLTRAWQLAWDLWVKAGGMERDCAELTRIGVLECEQATQAEADPDDGACAECGGPYKHRRGVIFCPVCDGYVTAVLDREQAAEDAEEDAEDQRLDW